MYLTLFADQYGEVFEHPHLAMLGRTADRWELPGPGEMIPLPGGASLVMVPEHYPVGWDTEKQRAVLLQKSPYGGEGRVYAVAALLPQGFTRTYLPAGVVPKGRGALPLLGYAAVGLKNDRIYVAAIQTDRHHRWHPRYYNTNGLQRRVERRLQAEPGNRILQHLSQCACSYGCFTAQNIFYERWEGGIPSMPACNAACLGCISERHGKAPSPQQRLNFIPEVEEIASVGTHHLEKARGGIISFGQGCEGEPSLNHARLAEATRMIRRRTERGTININTNAGYPEGIRDLVDAGLNSMRVTMFSCRRNNYEKYHRPRDYGLEDVEASIRFARKRGVCVSINLLTFPGFTDQAAEVEELLKFLSRNDVNMVQLRNLNLDPDELFQHFPYSGNTLGIKGLIRTLRGIKGLKVTSYTHSP